jgi:uncharacterized protein (TIGR03663 family)
MADTIKCPKCGEENPSGNRFCDSCGAKLVQAAAAPVKEEALKPADKKKIKIPSRESKEPRPAADDAYYGDAASLAPPGTIFINWEIVAWVIIVVVAFALRFAFLGDKPLHHDESMHAFYSWKLFKGQGYSYNPMMHGPFHYHATALAYFLFGVSDYTARVSPAIWGMLGVFLLLAFRPYMGKTGTLIAALLMAVSPIFTYQARFIREDIFMAVDTIMIFIGLMRYFDSRNLNWLYLAATGLAFAWATKEANFITLFVFGTFLIGRWFWEYSIRINTEKFQKEGVVYRTVDYLLKDGKKDFIKALVLFVLIHGFLFFGKNGPFWPNFISNLKLVWDGYVGGLVYWLGQQGVARGSQPVYFYVLLIPLYEPVSVIFMLIASVYFIVTPSKRSFFNLFCIYWWIMALIIYSWAGEKMPWMAIHMLLPMLILAAQMFNEILARKDWGWKRSAAIALFVLLTLYSVHSTMNLCFYDKGASPKESMVYVQTSPDVPLVANKIMKLAKDLKGEKLDSTDFRSFDTHNMEIVCEDYCTWPFAWYLRDFNKIAYDPKNVPDSEIGKPIILSGIEEAAPGHDLDVRARLTKETKMPDGSIVSYVGTRYKLREWWAPDEKKWWDAPLFSQPNVPGKLEMLWNRFMYREVWNDLGSYDFVVYVRKDLMKYWTGGLE